MAEANSTNQIDLWGEIRWRTCTKCKASKPFTHFSKRKTGKLGVHAWCKNCVHKRSRELDRLFPDKKRTRGRRQRLMKNFGITIQEYEEMHERQNGVCAICKRPSIHYDKRWQKIKRLSVDHCHKTGKVRGLLCKDCNYGIGHFRDDPNCLRAAAAYIEDSV